MKKLRPYKGYTAIVEFDSDEMVLHGRLANLQDVVSFHAESVGQLHAAFEEAVDDYLNLCRERGEEPDRPYSGRFVVRLDPELHRPVPPLEGAMADLSYLGTYAADRQAAVEALLLEPARRLPERRFLIGGAQYPEGFPWGENIFFVRHLPPADHPAFFSSSRLTLNVTRRAMADMGWCPSGRLFEAAACGTPLLSDAWEGLDAFFTPGREVLTARTAEDAVAALDLSDAELRRIGQAGRERVLGEHTSDHRAAELEALLSDAAGPAAPASELEEA